MTGLPSELASLVEALQEITDRNERIQALISIAEQYRAPSPEAHPKPYPEEHRVPGCESEVFVWAQELDGRWSFDFAVENPQGMSAMAMAVLLKDGLSGLTPTEVQAVPEDLVYAIFGRELSMGKSMGLINMIRVCKHLARA